MIQNTQFMIQNTKFIIQNTLIVNQITLFGNQMTQNPFFDKQMTRKTWFYGFYVDGRKS